MAVSADGRRAVSGGGDGTVEARDLALGVELASFCIRPQDHCPRRHTARYARDSRHFNRLGALPVSVNFLKLGGYE